MPALAQPWSRLALACTSLSVAAAAYLAAPAPASACGGTFCDAGPQQMPVDQTGENILFVMDGGRVEAHIQIQYDGDAERFAWLIPLTAVPDVTVGSQALFDNLLAGTVPTFQLLTNFEPCDDEDDSAFGCGGFGGGRFESSDLAGGGDSAGETGAGGDEGGPEILARGTAGAFEFVALTGDTVQEIVDWLDENGYAQDDDAPPILQEYLDENFLFLAVKLQSGASVDEIQPLVVSYEGNEPCVPIRLTRIAATPDMGIRAFFLGEERYVPTNYRHVLINPLKIDWPNLGDNYEDVVTMAVDDEGADGHAFVTEYAGTSEVVPTDGILGPQWNGLVFQSAEPTDVVNLLENQGLMACFGQCEYFHPMVEPLLATYLPVPSGIAPDAFYGDLAGNAEFIDLEAWDAEGFSADFAERIVDPAVHALDLLEDSPVLTRMYTTISPEEMTEDPMFQTNGDLGDVDNLFVATQTITCEGRDYLDLEDGRRVHLETNGDMPTFDDAPWSLKVEQIPAAGPGQDVEDNTGDVDDALDDWNDANPLASDTDGCGCLSNNGKHGRGLAMTFILFGIAAAGRRRRTARPPAT